MKTCQKDRLQQLEDALRDFGPNSQNLLSTSVQKPWEREITRNQVPYYIKFVLLINNLRMFVIFYNDLLISTAYLFALAIKKRTLNGTTQKSMI